MTRDIMALQNARETLPEHFKLALFALAAVLLLNSLLLFIDYLGTYTPVAPIRENIKHAFDTGELTRVDHLMNDSRRGYNQFNDCLIAGMAISRPTDRLHDTLSPSYYISNDKGISKYGDSSTCKALQEAAFNPDAGTTDSLYYHRYILGQRTLARIALTYIELQPLRVIFKVICYTLLLVMFSVGLWKFLASHRGSPENLTLFGSASQPLLLLISSIYFAVFYGLEYYGQSLNHAPSEILLFTFMIAAVWFNLLGSSLTRFYLAIAVFGCLTVYYEFLSGPIPISAAVLLAMIALIPQAQTDIRGYIYRLLGGGLVFCLAIVLSLVFNIITTSLSFGWEVIGDVANRVQMRTGSVVILGNSLLDKEYLSQIDSIKAQQVVHIGWLDVLQSLRWSLHQITWGSHYLGYAVTFSTGLMFIYSLFTFSRTTLPIQDKARLLALSVSTLAVPFWYFVFKNHTYINCYFMVRPVVWLFVMGCLFFILALRLNIAAREVLGKGSK